MSRKILLADDSVTIRKVVELTFMEEDYELKSVADGGDAIAAFDELTPDLVIADVHMGEVGGFDVCQESKRRFPDVPVLLLVGTFEPFDPADVLKHDGDGFLKKPFDSQDLLRQVGNLLGDKKRDNEESVEAPDEDGQEEVVEANLEAAEVDEPAAAPVFDLEPEDAASVAADEEVPASGLSDADVDRIARRVVELISDGAVHDVAWEVVPDMAEVVIKERLRELESQVE